MRSVKGSYSIADTINNTVTIISSNIQNSVYGGMSYSGFSNFNEVTITSSYIKGKETNVYGGYSNGLDRKVPIAGCTATHNIKSSRWQ